MSLDVYEKIENYDKHELNQEACESIALDHLLREKGRFKVNAQSGTEVRVFLERGKTLCEGELLKSQCGKMIRVDYAPEPVMRATAENWPDFVRACYHLGNRHVRLEIGELYLKIVPDHVLSELLQSLGLRVEERQDIFRPEPGAYSKHGAHHH